MEQQQTWRRELPNYKQVAPEIEDLPFQAREAINVLRGKYPAERREPEGDRDHKCGRK